VSVHHQNQHVAHGKQVLGHVYDVGHDQTPDCYGFNEGGVFCICEHACGSGVQLNQVSVDGALGVQQARQGVGDIQEVESVPLVVQPLADKLNPRLAALTKYHKREG